LGAQRRIVGGAPHEGGVRKSSWSLACGTVRRMVAADADAREVDDGERLLVEDGWCLSPHHAFPHGSPSPTETGMRRMSWWRGGGVVRRFREKDWRPADGPFAADGGRCNGE
jgi:hypothetical protein